MYTNHERTSPSLSGFGSVDARHGGQQLAVARGHGSPLGEDLVDALDLRDAHRCRQLVEAVVVAKAVVLEPLAGVGPALVRERLQAGLQLGIVGGDHASLARRDLLVRVEGEDRGVAVRADAPPLRERADGLGGILDHGEPVACGDLVDAIDLAGVAEDVHRQDRARPRRDRGLDRGGVDVERVGVDVDEDGRPPLVQDAVGRRDEARRRGDHLVAGADARQPDREVQSGRAARDRRRVGGSGERREVALEAPQERTEAEDARAQRLEHELLLPRPDVRSGEADHACRAHRPALTSVRASRSGSRGTRRRAASGRG